jgi:hypothetical protein
MFVVFKLYAPALLLAYSNMILDRRPAALFRLVGVATTGGLPVGPATRQDAEKY